ncbi:MAG: Solitary outer membrane autotransporter beta-barrel domain [Verrucomicrobiota bacterium]
MNSHSLFSRAGRNAGFAVGFLSLLVSVLPARAQTPAEISDLRNSVGNRIEAATILGGDFGMAGASYNKGSDGNLTLSKFGGWGDIGDPQQLGDLPIAWQPQLQGEMGYLSAKRDFTAEDTFNGGSLDGAQTKYHDFSIQFGGGPRLWFNDNFSIAPTFMGMYGHTENTLYTNNNAVAAANQALAKQLGLVDYSVDTWTIRPAVDFQYVYTWRRTIFTLNSDPVYFHTESFSASNPNVNVNGNSETWMNKIDVDVPLGKELWGHELRTGGYFSRTEFYGDIKDGLGVNHLYEIHGRVVLDYLNQLWKVQWIGIGYSYFWGNGGFTGNAIGLDVAFQF